MLFRRAHEGILVVLHRRVRTRTRRTTLAVLLGSDWQEIRKYREFEIAPTGDWIDLAIDLSRKSYDRNWRSGWKTAARIDDRSHIWYAAARVPLHSVSETPVRKGTRWRVNLYRIEGDRPDSRRHFLCWQLTCVENHDPNHVHRVLRAIDQPAVKSRAPVNSQAPRP